MIMTAQPQEGSSKDEDKDKDAEAVKDKEEVNQITSIFDTKLDHLCGYNIDDKTIKNMQ